MSQKNNFFIKDVITITSRLPWWAGLLLAIFSYLLLSMYASQEVLTPSVQNSSQIGAVVFSSITKVFASVGQYVLPILFVVGAGYSVFQRRKRTDLLKRAASDESDTAIDSMTWREFEMLVGEAFRKQGFKVTETPEGADGGVDLVLEKDNKKILVQCKHWKSQKVGVKTVRELYGVLVDSGADEVNIVCSGMYTEDAKQFVEGKSIYLINGDQLLTIVENIA